jgi:hypothetical protein
MRLNSFLVNTDIYLNNMEVFFFKLFYSERLYGDTANRKQVLGLIFHNAEKKELKHVWYGSRNIIKDK